MDKSYANDTLVSVEDAQTIMLSEVSVLDAERIQIIEGFGRVLAEDITSDIDISPFASSAMDGFAIRLAGLEDPGMHFEIVGTIGAGDVFDGRIGARQALRIMTGAPLPEGADTVVPIEQTSVLGAGPDCPSGREVVLLGLPELGSHIRSAGEEARAGEVLLHSGESVTVAGCGLLASTGHSQVMVYRRPRVAVMATGNELVDASEVPPPGAIRDSNSYSIAAAVIEAGGIPCILPHLTDDPEVFAKAIGDAAESHDFVVTTGGAADGDFDFVTATIRKLGTLLFSKVNMKPGKSQSFGLIAGVPVIGLAGNPSAAACGFEMLVRPCLRKMQGHLAWFRPVVKAWLAEPFNKKPDKRRLYLRARLSLAADGSYLVQPDSQQNSALLGALNRSNCLMVIPESRVGEAAGEAANSPTNGQETPPAGILVDCLRLDLEAGTI